MTLEIQDIVSGQSFFSQHFPGDVPSIFMDPHSNILALVAGVTAGNAQHASDNEINSHFSSLNQKHSVYEIQLIDLNTGKKIRDLHVDSGKFSFTVKGLVANKNYVALSDSDNRVQVYSIANGRQIGTVFGGPADLSAAGLMSVLSQTGKIDLYDCSDLKKINEIDFPSQAIFAQISDDGERMLVLTADQTTYLVKTRPQQQTAAQTASN